MKVYGGLATISADNLSAHGLAGFNQSFSTGPVCRFCMTLYKDLNTNFLESDCVLRNEEIHRYHLQAIEANPAISITTYGVTKRCPFESLPYFATTECFPPDLMHDLLEGVIPLLVKLLLQAFVKKKYFTGTQFNNLLENFSFGHNDIKSKPVKISTKLFGDDVSGTISGKAIEKWCLYRILPFLIGNSVPNDEKIWKLYLLLRDITDILFAPRIEQESILYLKVQIGEFIEEFAQLFPGKVTPKLHYLLHYPGAIQRFGPLRHIWCMRFEGKHQYFKQVANVVRNFRNISFTLSQRHQLPTSLGVQF